MRRHIHRILPLTSFLLCTARYAWIARHYAVNVFIGDQWFYNEPTLFHRQSLWTIFRWQSGPWRQGLGGLLSVSLGTLTRWNSRYESFVAAALIIFTCILVFVLKIKITGKLSAWDSVIPLFVLTPVQFQTIVGVTSFSHGPLPFLLVIAFCLAWTIPNYKKCYASIVSIAFFSTYTGFGIFLGILCPIVLSLDWWERRVEMSREERRFAAIALLAGTVSLGSFFLGYKVGDGVCPANTFSNPFHYFMFVGFMFSNFFGLKAVRALVPSILFGSLLLIFAIVMLFHSLNRKRPKLIPFVLIGYSLLFAGATAYGRICLGLGAALGSRYMIYLVPAFLGIYLLTLSVEDPAVRATLLVAIAVLCLLSSAKINPDDRAEMTATSHLRTEWKQCYLAHHDLIRCNRQVGADVYSYPDTIQQNIDFLEWKQLNFYSEGE